MTFRGIRNALYPLVGVAIILLIWQLYTDLFGINRIVFQVRQTSCRHPSPIGMCCCANAGQLSESVLGFILAVVIGIPFAVCVANSRVLNLTLYPILIATQSIPKVESLR